ncbi:phosphoenolpyruvate synthase [soil metagenome]
MSNGWIFRSGAGIAPPSVSLIGGKAHNLARLRELSIDVPPWFVVTTTAFDDLVPAPPSTGAEAEEWERWRAEIMEGAGLPAPLVVAVQQAVEQTGLTESLLAVRSSAASEDGSAASFAGQFDTILGVRPSDVVAAVRSVWASAANEHALAYGGTLAPMAVVVQAMVDAEVSGVAFGADPVSGSRDIAVVNAVFGLGEGLVSGEVDADTFRVDFSSAQPSVNSMLALHREALRLMPGGGTQWRSFGAGHAAGSATLSPLEAIQIAATARRIGDAFGHAQDVEWALSPGDRRLRILQARPITTLKAAPEGERRVWDNSNIVESYSGVTSPLTFSFALSVYDDVYRQFCAVVGVPPRLVDQHRHVFANMLGLVRGRVYYQLLNWYRTLALLPGYAVNRAFMERMMGVRQKLENAPELKATSGKLSDTARLGRMVGRLVRQSRGLKTAVPAFHTRVDAALAPLARVDLGSRSPDDLLNLYRSLEEDLLRNWQTPLVNDFFAMIWFGVLGRLVEKWLPDAPPTLVNDLLTHEGGIVSTEPARLVTELALRAAADPAVMARLAAHPDDSVLAREIAADPDCSAFQSGVDAYLARFGDRCMNELKLETITLSEDPAFLYQTIRSYIAGGVKTPDPTREGEVRRAAEQRLSMELKGLRRRLFQLVLRHTRIRVRDRENLRFERTRVFGVVRRIFVALGHRMHDAEVLESPRDIFFLRVEEIFGHLEGTGTDRNLAAIVELRKAEWAGYQSAPPPPDRFESVGPVSEERWIVPEAPLQSEDGRTLRGIGCCPGVIRARIRIVRDPREAGKLSDRILVAERTDPGWTLLFPAARGLLVERGSLLSHSAIVAREVGLPCIVSIPALLSTLRDGEMVEMDGTTGVVRRLDG